jgi:streptogramin lyase/photosystem II stability/assembly factor-like uncharacterized protein
MEELQRPGRLLAIVAGLLLAVAFSPSAGAQAIKSFPLPGVGVLTGGPDGNLWYLDPSSGKVGRMTTSGAFTTFSIPTAGSLGLISAGPDGNVWFCETGANNIGRITPAGQITEFPVSPGTGPETITSGPDGNLWYSGSSRVFGRMTPDGSFTQFPVAGFVGGITRGPDGNVWFTESTNKVARVTPAGVVKEFSLPTANAGAASIVGGADGNLWFVETSVGKIGRVTPDGVFTEFPIPTSGAFLQGTALGSDGKVWFLEGFNRPPAVNNKIGRINRLGLIEEFDLPVSSIPYQITAGPDGAIWFSDFFAKTISRVDVNIAVARSPIAHATPPAPPIPWTAVGPDGGADVRTIAVDPTSPSIIYAGTSGSGIFKSVDGGAHWSAINNGVPTLSAFAGLEAIVPVGDLGIDPRNPSTVYAAMGAPDPATGAAEYGPSLVSTNGGKDWKAAGTGLPPNSFGNAVAIDPILSGTVYMGFDPSGIFKTTDGGATWSAVNTGLLNGTIKALAIDPFSSLTVYAGTGLGVAKTVNGGASWTPINNGLSKLNVQTLVVAPSRPSTLYASALSSSFQPGFFRSLDGGLNWAELTSPSSSGADSLAVDPTNPSVVYASTEAFKQIGVSKSLDGGQSWSSVSVGVGLPTLNVTRNRLGVDPQSPSNVYFGARNGVFKTTNGGTSWTPAVTGLSGLQIAAIARDPSAAGTLYASVSNPAISLSATVAKSTDSGATWTVSTFQFSESSLPALAVDPNTSSTIYVAGGLPYRSTDGGATWVQLFSSSIGRFSALAAPRGSPGVLYGVTSQNGVFKSSDRGTTWVPIKNGLPNLALLSAVAVDPANPATVNVGGGSGLFRSTDSGASWNAVHNGLPNPTESVVTSLLAAPTSPTSIYAAFRLFFSTGSALYRSLDGGITWASVSIGLPASYVSALAFDPSPPGTLYAGTAAAGVYRAELSRLLWTPLNTNLQNILIKSLAVSEGSPATAYAGTAGNGIFRLQLPTSQGPSLGVPFRKGG